MITVQILRAYGEINSVVYNELETDGVGGALQLTIDSMGEGEAYPILIFRKVPNVLPRISVARENRVIKAGA